MERPRRTGEGDNQKVNISISISDLSEYVFCGQLLGVRGYKMPTFRIATDGVMSIAEVTIEGQDGDMVDHVMTFVEKQKRASKLDGDKAHDLAVATIELLGLVKTREKAKSQP